MVITVADQTNAPGSVLVGDLLVAPDLVEAGHRHHAPVLGADEERLLERLAGLAELLGRVPLVVAVGREQAASLLQRPLERRLLGEGLDPGVDHPVADGDVLGPRRDQAPAHGGQPALGSGVLRGVARDPVHDGVDVLGRRDVVVRLQRLLDHVGVDLELLDEVFGFAAGRISATHTSSLSHPTDSSPRSGQPL